MMPSVEILREMAEEAGFDLVGLGPSDPLEDREHFLTWIELGRHGSMDYLERNAARIADPGRLLPEARGAISLAVDYGRPRVQLPGGALVARYAAGRDYHRALGKRLRSFTRKLVADGVPASSLRSGVDAIPFLERSLAWRSGVGFLAKSSGVIHPRRGPWLMLAEVLTTAELPTSGPSPGSCGTCTACLDACPTGAIVAPFELDARKCVSYTTIELRGPIPRELREPQGSWLFGCDICIEVCPFERRGKARAGDPDMALHPAIESYDLVGVLELSAEDYEQNWCSTSMRRAGRNGLRRNAAVVLGNLRAASAAPNLALALKDSDPAIRASAAWALSRIGKERAAVDRACQTEPDLETRRDIGLSLDSFARA